MRALLQVPHLRQPLSELMLLPCPIRQPLQVPLQHGRLLIRAFQLPQNDRSVLRVRRGRLSPLSSQLRALDGLIAKPQCVLVAALSLRLLDRLDQL